MRKAIAVPVLAGLIGMTGLAVPVAAQASAGPTTTTLSVTGGELTITTPDSAVLGAVTVGATSTSGQLGTVTVADNRATTSGSWTATVESTALVTGGRTGAETIPASDLIYSPGTAFNQSGLGIFTPGTPGAMSEPLTAFSAADEVGATAVSWDPTIDVALPPAVVTGLYTGTITHSVA